ncbi:Uncharacterised protein [Mycobacteroides abscessus]|nr:Uncharacterised protein [Mycobacteroides abscessus]
MYDVELLRVSAQDPTDGATWLASWVPPDHGCPVAVPLVNAEHACGPTCVTAPRLLETVRS